MSNFIKLTNIILNTNDLHSIIIRQNKYYIKFKTKKIDCLNWCFAGFGYGFIFSNIYEIEICKNEHPNDYKIVSDWIDKI